MKGPLLLADCQCQGCNIFSPPFGRPPPTSSRHCAAPISCSNKSRDINGVHAHFPERADAYTPDPGQIQPKMAQIRGQIRPNTSGTPILRLSGSDPLYLVARLHASKVRGHGEKHAQSCETLLQMNMFISLRWKASIRLWVMP